MLVRTLGTIALATVATVLVASCASQKKPMDKTAEQPKVVKQKSTSKAPHHYKGSYQGKKR